MCIINIVLKRTANRLGSLAQLGEHLPYKQRVTGSSPVTSTMKSTPFVECFFVYLYLNKGNIRNMNRKELEQYIQETYVSRIDYPWEKYPNYEVFRHENKKWFALVWIFRRVGWVFRAMIAYLW